MQKIALTKRWWVIALVGVGLLVPVGHYALRSISRKIETQILEQKIVRETTGTVKAKEFIRFDEVNHSYLHEDGYRVERQPGGEEWRIYYQIDNFDQIDEPTRSHLLDKEIERVTRGRLRFRIVEKEQYDRIAEGDKLNVGWQWHGDDKISVVTAGKPLLP